MKNFIFKSSSKDTDLPKIISSLKLLLDEQRHQRVDLAKIEARLRLLSPTKVENMDYDESSGSEQLSDE